MSVINPVGRTVMAITELEKFRSKTKPMPTTDRTIAFPITTILVCSPAVIRNYCYYLR